jgi:uncharacterized protein with HEPN domain
MSDSDMVRLRHARDAAREAVQFVEGRSRADLDNDRMLNLALVQLLEIIGEAVRALSPAFCQSYPEIPWKKMVGMRDRLIHGYFDINLDIVWETIKKDLPDLLIGLDKVIPPEYRFRRSHP